MIKIEIQAENAKELYAELLVLLGGAPESEKGAGNLAPVESAQYEHPTAPKEPAEKQTKPRKQKAETPAVETPAVETPAVETPAVETPAVETPAVETPAVETPAVETPANGKPVTLDDLRELAFSKGIAKKAAIASLLQNKYGVQVFPKVEVPRYAELYADIQAL